MSDANPRSTAAIAGHPLHPMIIPFPIAFFAGAFFADIGYLATDDRAWALGAAWLLGAGLATAAIAAVLGFVDFFGDRAVRAVRATWLHMISNVLAVLLEVVNLYLRYVEGVELAVSPAGVILSGVVVFMLAFSGWMGGEMVYKHRVGVKGPLEQPSSASRAVH